MGGMFVKQVQGFQGLVTLRYLLPRWTAAFLCCWTHISLFRICVCTVILYTLQEQSRAAWCILSHVSRVC
jgi:hypothetical protein